MNTTSTTRWLILSLCTLTIIIVYTIPTLMLPVLFAEMAADLDLDIVQLGIAWGSISLSSLVIGLFGGAIGDRLGSKRMLGIACLLTGLSGALRGLAPNFTLLIVTLMLYGLIAPSLPPNLHKAGAYLFPEQRGISTGAISLGFAFALFIGSRYTATWLSPLVGGWRNIMFLFAIFGIIFAVIWFYLIPDQALPQPTNQNQPFFTAVFSSLRQILSIRNIWVVGIASTLFWACIRGFLGYTPLYLRGLGWTEADADGALSLFFLASLILTLPLSFWAARVENKRPFLVTSMLATGGGVLLLSTGDPLWIYVGLIGAGLVFDAFMAIHQAAVLDLKEIGSYSGSALGILVMFREIGGFLSPPTGNALSQFGAHIPYLFWGGMGLLAAVAFLFFPKSNQHV